MSKDKETKKSEIQDEKLRAIAAEFPEFSNIISGLNFNAGHWRVEDCDPGMRYYFAAPGFGRPDSVATVKQLGYRESAKKHDCPDLVLMETPMALYKHRKEKEQAIARRQMEAVRREVTEGKGPLEVMDSVRSPRGGKSGFDKLHGG